MNLAQLANLGEFIGGVAVLVTLIYLAAQLRFSTNATRLAVYQDANDSWTSFLDSVSKDNERMEIFLRGLQDLASLGTNEFRVFHGVMASLCRRWEGVVFVMRHAEIKDEDWAGQKNSMISVLRMPGALAWWEITESLYNRPFREFVEAARDAAEPEWSRRFFGHLAALEADDREAPKSG